MGNKYMGLKRYFIVTGIIAHLLIGYCLYSFTSPFLSQTETFPKAVLIAANKINRDYPSFALLGDSLSAIGGKLQIPNYFWRPFLPDYWPTVGPDWSSSKNANRTVNNAIFVSDPSTLSKALRNVSPGQHIILAPGTYSIRSKRLQISKHTPSAQQPITLRALKPGKVTLELDTAEGLYLNQPYWRITGIRFVGKCNNQARCEHAIHVVGDADHIVIEHNEFIDFNAAIKVNKYNNAYPDHGIIQNNHFHFTGPRKVSNPVTPINVDHGNNWLISRNIIRDFIKSGGNKISYGAFIKGGAERGILENNLVICNTKHHRFAGSQVGLSLGGGGMAQQHRRGKISAETINAVIRNNIVMHCNDVGLYINKSQKSTINNNLLYHTQGIDIRYPQSDALIENNILSGEIRLRDHGKAESTANHVVSRNYWTDREKIDGWFSSPSIGNFSFKSDERRKQLYALAVPYRHLSRQESKDFCGNTIRPDDRFSGPFKSSEGCFRQLSAASDLE